MQILEEGLEVILGFSGMLADLVGESKGKGEPPGIGDVVAL